MQLILRLLIEVKLRSFVAIEHIYSIYKFYIYICSVYTVNPNKAVCKGTVMHSDVKLKQFIHVHLGHKDSFQKRTLVPPVIIRLPH